jgi:hypothetical protein
MHANSIEHLKSLVTTRVSSPAQQAQRNDKEAVQHLISSYGTYQL